MQPTDAKLLREYRCQKCESRLVEHIGDDGPYIACGQCGCTEPNSVTQFTPFWGCSEYKDGCRGKRNIGPDGKPEDDTGEFSPEDFD